MSGTVPRLHQRGTRAWSRLGGVRQPSSVGARRGFTLLEMLITVVVITLGTASLGMAFSRAIFASGDAADLRIATALAQERLEEIQGASYASLASEARSAVAGFTGFERAVTVTSAPGGTDSNFKRVDVTVYWSAKGGELSTTLTSAVVNK